MQSRDQANVVTRDAINADTTFAGSSRLRGVRLFPAQGSRSVDADLLPRSLLNGGASQGAQGTHRRNPKNSVGHPVRR